MMPGVQAAARIQQAIQAVSAQLASVCQQEEQAQAQLQGLEQDLAQHAQQLPHLPALPAGLSLVRTDAASLVLPLRCQADLAPPAARLHRISCHL